MGCLMEKESHGFNKGLKRMGIIHGGHIHKIYILRISLALDVIKEIIKFITFH